MQSTDPSWYLFCRVRVHPVLLQQTYRLLHASGGGHVVDLVLAHVALGGLPVDVQGAGGGVSHTQVPHATQRLWRRWHNEADCVGTMEGALYSYLEAIKIPLERTPFCQGCFCFADGIWGIFPVARLRA